MQPFSTICWIEYTLMEGFVTRPIWCKLVSIDYNEYNVAS
jgi:hypothetical protein